MHYDKGEYRKIPKISPGDYILRRPFLKGLLCFTLYSRANFKYKPAGSLYSEGRFKGGGGGGFLRYEFGGLIFGGAYTWRGLYSEFYSN